MHHPLSQLDTFLIAMLIIFSFPFLIWRFLRTDYFAPMVIIQIIAGIIIGPSLLGRTSATIIMSSLMRKPFTI